MKRSLLILFCTLLGFTAMSAPTMIQGCIKHKQISVTNTNHFGIITLDVNASVIMYVNGLPFAGPISPTGPNGANWVYEFDLGSVPQGDPHCINNIEFVEVGTPYIPGPAFAICHCNWDIQDACRDKMDIGGTLYHILTVTFGPDVQGVNVDLWRNNGAFQGMTFLYKTFTGTNWIYVYSIAPATTYIPTPLPVYVTYGGIAPPIGSPFTLVRECRAGWYYACYEHKSITEPPVTGPAHRLINIAYAPGIGGLDVPIYWWNGTSMIGPINPIDKDFVNGVWHYTYDLGLVSWGNEPLCYDIYPEAPGGGIPTEGVDPHHLVCACTCDASFSYCINTNDPNTVHIKLNQENPMAAMTLKVTDMANNPVYQSYGVGWHTSFSLPPGEYIVCIKMVFNDQECEHCEKICVAEQPGK